MAAVRDPVTSPTCSGVAPRKTLYATPAAVLTLILRQISILTFLEVVVGVILTLKPVTSTHVPFVLVVENASVLTASIATGKPPPPPLGVCQVAAVLLVAVSTCPLVGAVAPETETVVVAVLRPRAAVASPAVRPEAVPVRLAPEPLVSSKVPDAFGRLIARSAVAVPVSVVRVPLIPKPMLPVPLVLILPPPLLVSMLPPLELVSMLPPKLLVMMSPPVLLVVMSPPPLLVLMLPPGSPFVPSLALLPLVLIVPPLPPL